LAVQDVLKSIKGITIEDDGWEDEEDEEVEIEEDEMDGNNDLHPEGFALAMHKIRELIKVWLYITYKRGFKLLQSSFVCYIEINY